MQFDIVWPLVRLLFIVPPLLDISVFIPVIAIKYITYKHHTSLKSIALELALISVVFGLL